MNSKLRLTNKRWQSEYHYEESVMQINIKGCMKKCATKLEMVMRSINSLAT